MSLVISTFQNYWAVSFLVLSCGLVNRVSAQAFTTLHSFPPYYINPQTNSDGLSPSSGLALGGTVLYGTAAEGGSFGQGALFKINTDGSGFTNVYSFTGGSDGANPYGDLILSGNTLFGTAQKGGTWSNGTVFALNTDGTGFRTLHSFAATTGRNPYNWATNSEGSSPLAGLLLSGTNLYGTAYLGGATGWGTVFGLNIDGTGFAVLHTFTNCNEGANPVGGLVLSSNVLYGTTTTGGNNFAGTGTIYALHPDDGAFTTIYVFSAASGLAGPTNSDGSYPVGALIISGNRLYGTANQAGQTPYGGTVFALNTDGTGFTNLHSFDVAGGYGPTSGVLLLGNTLYGTTLHGGGGIGVGGVFAVTTNGTGFTYFYSFTGGNDGAFPYCRLVASGNTLYGTTEGDQTHNGSVFGVSFQPQLSIVLSGLNTILSWPANYIGFDYSGFVLQSTTNLASGIWTTNLPAPSVVNGQNVVTNPISFTQQFFRLHQ